MKHFSWVIVGLFVFLTATGGASIATAAPKPKPAKAKKELPSCDTKKPPPTQAQIDAAVAEAKRKFGGDPLHDDAAMRLWADFVGQRLGCTLNLLSDEPTPAAEPPSATPQSEAPEGGLLAPFPQA
jgi:hypothetical protein